MNRNYESKHTYVCCVSWVMFTVLRNLIEFKLVKNCMLVFEWISIGNHFELLYYMLAMLFSNVVGYQVILENEVASL